MKSVVIATNNPDKFKQISQILTSLKIPSQNFQNLNDLHITDSPPESGTMMDRAKQKALHCLSQIKPGDYSKYLCIIANDTGTKLPTLNVESAESKKIASQILAGELLKPGDPIHYVYAYAVILLPSLKMLTAQAEIPFTYLGNPKGLKLIEGQNTMNEVKSLVGQNFSHNQLPDEEVILYRLKHLKESLEPIIKDLNKNE